MYKGDDFIFGRFSVFKEGTQIKWQMIIKIQSGSGAFSSCPCYFRWQRWCHCLGHASAERTHAIYLFTTVSFTVEPGGARGLWLNFASLPLLQTPTSPAHPPTLSSVTFWLDVSSLPPPSPASPATSPFPPLVPRCNVSLSLSLEEIWGVHVEKGENRR